MAMCACRDAACQEWELEAFVAERPVGGHAVRPAWSPCPRLAQCPSEMQATALDAVGISEAPLLDPAGKLPLR